MFLLRRNLDIVHLYGCAITETFIDRLIKFTKGNFELYVDNNSSFDELLKKSGSVSLHHRNIQQLAIEIYKALNNLSSPLMSELFMIKENKYNLRNEVVLASNLPRSTNYGINSVSYLAPKLWKLISNEFRNCITLNLFGKTTWIPHNCPCNLCRVYIHGVGFI